MSDYFVPTSDDYIGYDVNTSFYDDDNEYFAIITATGDTLEVFDNEDDAYTAYSQWEYDGYHPEDCEVIVITSLEYANTIEW